MAGPVECRLIVTEDDGQLSVKLEIPESATDTIAGALVASLYAKVDGALCDLMPAPMGEPRHAH